MKHIFIINKYSANKKINNISNRIPIICEKLKIDYIIEIVDSNTTTEEALEKYKNSKNIIIGVGGDGTVNRILNCIIDTDNILGIIPLGTGNDFYRSLKLNKELYQTIDVGKINDKYFLNVACFGIDADVANNAKIIKNKLIPIKQRYNISILYTFMKYKNKELEILYNNKKVKGKYVTIAVCNGRYYGGGYDIAPSSELDDGLFDIYIIGDLKKRTIPSLILKIKKGLHESFKKTSKIKATGIIIKSKENLVCNIDGEEVEGLKYNIELIKKKITIYNNEELIKMLSESK